MYKRQFGMLLARSDVWVLKDVAYLLADVAGVVIRIEVDFGLLRQNVTIEVSGDNPSAIDGFCQGFLVPLLPSPSWRDIEKIARQYGNSLKDWYEGERRAGNEKGKPQ